MDSPFPGNDGETVRVGWERRAEMMGMKRLNAGHVVPDFSR